MAKQGDGGKLPLDNQKQNQTPAVLKQGSPTPSERFTDMVVREFAGTGADAPALTGHQKRLIQNYFISTDMALKMAEEKRLKKSEEYRDKVAITWDNVNLPSLALNVVACARIGYDPALPNHINMIPYKNNTTEKYDVGFMEGYRGRELKAMKYGYNTPDDVVVEVVYSKDDFKVVKKDKDNEIETYTFSIKDPFDRGEIVGGFYYHVYKEEARKNVLVIFNLHEINKRKPKYASVEFWGGKKDKWENGKKSGTEEVDGWFHEMVYKTLYRAAYGAITIDSEKIDDNLMRLMQVERDYDENLPLDVKEQKAETLQKSANKKNLNIEDVEVVEEPKDAVSVDDKPAPEPEPPAEEGKGEKGKVNGIEPGF